MIARKGGVKSYIQADILLKSEDASGCLSEHPDFTLKNTPCLYLNVLVELYGNFNGEVHF